MEKSPLQSQQLSTSKIFVYCHELAKQGYRPQTIQSHSRILRFMARNCDLEDPESVREFIASRHSTGGRKENLVDCYSKYAKSRGIAFSEPRYTREDSLPFIPLQQEIEALIEASRDLRHATMLRVVYETGMRIGEASRLQFKDFDFEKRTVRVVPEKGSRARELKLSERLCAMLKLLFAKYPGRANPLPHPEASRKHMEYTRRYLAQANSNPRFLNIHLHTLRHFRATMLYSQTKDLLYVQHILGHRSISNTIKYTHLVDWKDSEQYVAKAARTLEDATSLIESGFDFVTDLDGIKLFRKRK